MKLVLFLLPFLVLITAFLIYRHNGKKEILKFDLVQFIYAFIVAPIIFIWLKSFLFYFISNEADIFLSQTQIFIFDSFYSLIFLFIYAAIVIHSMTKSLENKRHKDPLFDLFKHTESIHLRFSHFGMYFGIMILTTLFSLLNIYFPLSIEMLKLYFYLIILLGSLFGVLSFLVVWLSIYSNRFLKLMKALYALFFLIHVVSYFIFEIRFNSDYSVYWFVFFSYFILVFLSFLLERSERIMKIVNKLHHKKGWKKGNFLLTK
jgi:hypothetical protein